MKLTAEAQAALDKLGADLEWRGPNGTGMGHVVIPRAQAEALLAFIEAMPIETYKLPCDVHLPPRTYIRKGSELATLMVALKAREGRTDEVTTFPECRP